MGERPRHARWNATAARKARGEVPKRLEENRECLFLVLHEEMFRGVKQAEVDRAYDGEDGQHLKFVHYISPERFRVW